MYWLVSASLKCLTSSSPSIGGCFDVYENAKTEEEARKILDEVKKDIQDDGLILDDADLDKVAGGWKVRWA